MKIALGHEGKYFQNESAYQIAGEFFADENSKLGAV